MWNETVAASSMSAATAWFGRCTDRWWQAWMSADFHADRQKWKRPERSGLFSRCL